MLIKALIVFLYLNLSVDAKLSKKDCSFNNVRMAYMELVEHTGSTSKFKYNYKSNIKLFFI